MRRRNRIFRRAKITGSEHHYLKYKKIRNEIVRRLKDGKSNFFNKLSSSSNKSLWKALKKLNNKHQNLIPSLCESNNICAVTDKEKSDMLKDYFSQCWNNSEPPLSQTEDVISHNDAVDDDLICSEEQVLHLLQNLDVGKASGSDDISANMHA